MSNRDRATPVQLAEEVIKVVGDSDSGTALTALQIARLLILHRDDAMIEFERSASAESSD